MSKESEIAAWLNTEQELKAMPWMEPLVMDVTEEENPFTTQSVKQCLADKELEDHPVLRLFAEKCQRINFSKTSVRAPVFNPDRKIVFRRQFADEAADFEPNRKAVFAPEAAFFIGSEKNRDLEPPVKRVEMKVKETQVFCASLKSFEFAEAFVEPIIGSAFLFSEGQIISETWNFSLDGSTPFFDRLGKTMRLNHQAGFNYRSVNKMAYLVIILKRVIQPENGSACNRYYMKPSSGNAKSATESVEIAWPRMAHVFAPFAWTFAPIPEIISSKEGYEMPQLVELSLIPAEDEMNTMIQETEHSGQKQKGFPFKITMSMTVKSVMDPKELAVTEGYTILHSLLPAAVEPSLRFRNQLGIMLRDVRFKLPSDVKAKHVFAMMSLQVGLNGQKLCAFVNQNSDMHESMVTTVCQSSKTPYFNFMALVDLPRNIDKSLCLVIEYFDATVKKKGTSEKLIGMSYMPFFGEKGILTKSGVHHLNINYRKQTPAAKCSDKQNCTSVVLYFNSSLFYDDPKIGVALDRTANGGKLRLDLLGRVPAEVMVRNLFPVCEALLGNVVDMAEDVVEAFSRIASICAPVYAEFESFLIGFASDFALRSSSAPTPAFHLKLLEGWGNVLQRYGEKSGADRSDAYICDALFILIIKSLKLTDDKDVSAQVKAFVAQWTISIAPLAATGFLQAKRFVNSFANFLNLLFDIGQYSLTIDAIRMQIEAFSDSPNDHKILMFFLEQVMRPKLLFTSIVHLESLSELLNDLVLRAKNAPDSLPLQDIFSVLLNTFSFFQGNHGKTVVAHLMPCFTAMNPLSEFPFTATNEVHSSVLFFLYLIKNVSRESFVVWWEDADKKSFFESLHFVIDTMKLSTLSDQDEESAVGKLSSIECHYSSRPRQSGANRSFIAARRNMGSMKEKKDGLKKEEERRIYEIVYSAEFSVINVLKILCSIDKGVCISEITLVLYHLLSTNMAVDVLNSSMELISRLIKQSVELMMTKCTPILTKFLVKVLELSAIDREPCEQVFTALFEADVQRYKNNNRSYAVSTRAIYLSEESGLGNVKTQQILELQRSLMSIRKTLSQPTEDIDMRSSMLYEESVLVSASPDSRYDCLSGLVEHHRENEYHAEEVQTMLLQAAIVLEYLTIDGRLPKDLWSKEHPALVFLPVCSASELAVCPNDVFRDLPLVPSYCDSTPFTGYALVDHLMKTIERCRETKQYEYAGALVDFLWPLLEKHRAFGALKEVMSDSAAVYSELAEVPSEDDRLFGRYFRVSFYGTSFNNQDGKVYIYREKKLAHLYDVSARIVDLYKKLLGESAVELIMEKGAVDPSKLEVDKAYIQITFADPLIGKHDTSQRITLFEKSHNLNAFYYDTPFVEGGDKAHGSVDQQWLLRTIMNVKYDMPFVLRRQELSPSDVKSVKLQPIRVSYRQLRTRVNMLKEAIERCDYRQIQQLLHGSLLVQVNEGPSKLAEVFLTGGEDTKYTRKLKEAFIDFVKVHEEGLKVHAKYVTQNPDFVMLQHELEVAFTTLKEMIDTILK